MLSVSPNSSTISSQGWKETFRVIFAESVDPNRTYVMRFDVDGDEWLHDVESGKIDRDRVEFYLSLQEISEMGYHFDVGQVFSPLSLLVTMDVEGVTQLVEVWHA